MITLSKGKLDCLQGSGGICASLDPTKPGTAANSKAIAIAAANILGFIVFLEGETLEQLKYLMWDP
jgi:hypothetical protein